MSEKKASPTEFLSTDTGQRLAYYQSTGTSPTVVFLPGYASDMTGSKALYLEAVCRKRGQAFLRLDYSGHGESSGKFSEGTIGVWAADAVAVVRAVTTGPVLFVGSSMGGWIMLLAALAMPERTHGLVGIAAAPDFTEDLMWRGLNEDQRTILERDGELYLPSDYVDDPFPITLKLIEEAKEHLLLSSTIEIDSPVRLLQGLSDPDVPWETALKIAQKLTSNDVTVTLIKGAGHRLSDAEHLKLLELTVTSLLD